MYAFPDDSELMPSIVESNVNDEPPCDNIVLTTESNVPTKHQNGNNATEEKSNNITEENKIENNRNGKLTYSFLNRS